MSDGSPPYQRFGSPPDRRFASPPYSRLGTQALQAFRFCPFIGRDRMLARKRMASAISSGVIDAGAPPLASAHIFVSTEPGLMLFTRTPISATSTASDSVIAITAALLAQYDTKPGNFCGPMTPEIDATFTIAPLRFAIMAGSARRDIKNAPR